MSCRCARCDTREDTRSTTEADAGAYERNRVRPERDDDRWDSPDPVEEERGQ